MRISRQLLPVKIMIDQKQLENVESFKYLGSILTNDGRCTCEIKCRIAMAKAAFNKKRGLFTSTLDLKMRKKLAKCYIWSIVLYGADTWTLRAVEQRHLESFEKWCWRRMEKIVWIDHVRNEEVLLRVKKQRNILYEISTRKDNWIGHILRRKYLLQRVINPLKPELIPICYLLALLAHHFLHVSRIRVKSLTIRLLMSYIWSTYS